MIYLDTHVVAWLYAGEIRKLSERAKELVNADEIIISPIVRLELQYLFEIQRITEEADTIVMDLSHRIGLKISDQSFSEVVDSTLHYSWTRDPFDRIIVANAAIDHSILLTKDQNILANYEKAMW